MVTTRKGGSYMKLPMAFLMRALMDDESDNTLELEFLLRTYPSHARCEHMDYIAFRSLERFPEKFVVIKTSGYKMTHGFSDALSYRHSRLLLSTKPATLWAVGNVIEMGVHAFVNDYMM